MGRQLALVFLLLLCLGASGTRTPFELAPRILHRRGELARKLYAREREKVRRSVIMGIGAIIVYRMRADALR